MRTANPRAVDGFRASEVLAAIDIDGTLLRSDGTLSERTVRALRRISDAGVYLAFVTARPAWGAAAVVDAAGAGNVLIASTGATVHDLVSRRVLRVSAMPADRLRALVDALTTQCPTAQWAVDRETDRLVSTSWPAVLASQPALVRRVASLPAGAPVLCLMVVGCTPELGAALAGQFGLVCTSSDAGLLEFTAPDATKGAALGWVRQHLAPDRRRVVAYGDAPNDLSMFAVAHTAVGVGNAHPEVLRAADVVVASNDADGVAEHIEQLRQRLRSGNQSTGTSV